MQPIDRQALASVHGGFGALLGALLQAAPGILQGVSGIIGASKAGLCAAGAAPAAGPAQGPQQPNPAAMQAAPSSAPTSSGSSCACGSAGAAPQFIQMIRFV